MAQLVERYVRNVQATSSNLVISTNLTRVQNLEFKGFWALFFIFGRKSLNHKAQFGRQIGAFTPLFIARKGFMRQQTRKFGHFRDTHCAPKNANAYRQGIKSAPVFCEKCSKR